MAKIPYEKTQLEKWCKESYSYNQVLVKSGRTKASSNRETLKKYIKLYEIDISHFTSSTSPNPTQQKPTMIECTKCHQIKSFDTDFYHSGGKTRHVCKECVREEQRTIYQSKINFLNDYKQNICCKKCGENRFYVLQFHHRNEEEKEFAISDKLTASIKTLQNEMNKCDVLCSNCHMEWHYLKTHKILTNYNEWLNGEVAQSG